MNRFADASQIGKSKMIQQKRLSVRCADSHPSEIPDTKSRCYHYNGRCSHGKHEREKRERDGRVNHGGDYYYLYRWKSKLHHPLRAESENGTVKPCRFKIGTIYISPNWVRKKAVKWNGSWLHMITWEAASHSQPTTTSRPLEQKICEKAALLNTQVGGGNADSLKYSEPVDPFSYNLEWGAEPRIKNVCSDAMSAYDSLALARSFEISMGTSFTIWRTSVLLLCLFLSRKDSSGSSQSAIWERKRKRNRWLTSEQERERQVKSKKEMVGHFLQILSLSLSLQSWVIDSHRFRARKTP